MCNEKKGKFQSVKNTTVAFLLDTTTQKTVRHVNCHLLVISDGGNRCVVCHQYRDRLRAIYSAHKRALSVSSKTNFRYLHTPQRKVCVKSVTNEVRTAHASILRLKEKLAKVTSSQGVTIDEDLEKDIQSAIKSNNHHIEGLEKNSFKRIFWEQQVRDNYICSIIMIYLNCFI